MMRSEKEMFDLILSVAKSNERIRAVLLEGSRANPDVHKDQYQDYDINFFVTETMPFIEDKSWLLAFGTPLIVQEPDWVDNATGFFGDELHDFNRHYSYLTIFDDGNRIDFSLIPTDNFSLMEKHGEPVVVLLDKDGILPSYSAPSNLVYLIKKPNRNQFHGCCNEFWWCQSNVAKGIARDELPYAMEMLNHYVRDMLNKMVEWHIGIQTDFAVSAGKMGKYFKRYLSEDQYEHYALTYSDCNYSNIWKAIYAMCDLFRELALSVATCFGFDYKQNEENGIRAYLKKVELQCER